MRVSKYFKLNKKQFELDFVDVELNGDMPLFIDPYALSKREDLFSMESNQLIVSFFQKVIDDIKNSRYDLAQQNLNFLSEPNETRLGLSSKKPLGKGVSGKQSVDIFDKLKESKAVATGLLKDLSDCELVIPGIGRDKISDIVTNIIRIKLLEYTEQQCIAYGISMTKISSGRYWNALTNKWEIKYANLPAVNNSRLVLVPKAIVRYTLQYDHQKYYNGFVLDFLQEEHLNSNTSLVKLLKNGSRVVYKKDLKKQEKYKLSKKFLYEFSKEHPEVLQQYIQSLPKTINSLDDEQIEKFQENPEKFNYKELAEKLSKIEAGKKQENDYHELMIGILEAIFYPNLICPQKEEAIHEGRKRIDITYQNAANGGFFGYLVNHVPSPFIICECKNYNYDPRNPELDQLSGRFSPRRGKFGFLLCRKIDNKDLITKRCKDTANDDRGYIVALDDEDVIKLLNLKAEKNEKAIDAFLTTKFKDLVM